jgi:hypothetical protein
MTDSTWLIKDDKVNPYTFFQEVFIFYIFWWAMYNNVGNVMVDNSLFNRLPIEKRIEAKTRIISSIHAIILTTSSLCYLLDYINYVSYINFIPLSSAFGIFDMTIITLNYRYFKKGYVSTMIHHSIVVYAPVTFTSEYAKLIAQAYMFETTVPLIDTSWYLYNAKFNNTLGFKLNSIIALIVFFIVRVINSMYITYVIVWRDSNAAIFFSLVFLGLNIYWFKLLICLYLGIY